MENTSRGSAMPRDGAIIFSDLIGKLDVLRIECPKCERAGQYRVADLITRYGASIIVAVTITTNLGNKLHHNNLCPCETAHTCWPGEDAKYD
jgi:hypothetical protein